MDWVVLEEAPMLEIRNNLTAGQPQTDPLKGVIVVREEMNSNSMALEVVRRLGIGIEGAVAVGGTVELCCWAGRSEYVLQVGGM